MVLEVVSSTGKRCKNWFTMDVFAVPGPPRSNEACKGTFMYQDDAGHRHLL